MQGDRDFAEMIFLKPIWIRWPLYYVLMLSILLLGHFGQRQFIYFQF
jgi:hypothetical protein